MIQARAAAVLLLLLSTAVLADSTGELRRGKINSSKLCAECHEDIHASWSRSMHSASLSDPIFEASYMRAYLETSGAAKKVCLRCHAPVAALTGDLDLKDPVSREGITCDFCHSVVSVDLERRDEPFQVALDGVKRGPLGDANSPVHGVAKSALHESSEFCAGCHEYANEEGLLIFSTYSEWKASPQAAQGKTCQHCHMPPTPGDTVRSGLGATRRNSINLHNISGMHSSEQVRKAATAEIVSIRMRDESTAIVDVEVRNIGSGHSIPTGLPTRKLKLEVVLFANDRQVRRFERVYQKVLLDERGLPIEEDHHTILSARKVQDDNRLRPGERRLERFIAPVPRRASVSAEIKLLYVYEPKLLYRQPITIEIVTDRAKGGR